jgi:very-short-patch-repair endonuclease
MSKSPDYLHLIARVGNLPRYVREYRFAAPERDWRFDYAWPAYKIAVEVEGGVWSHGRHVRGSGFLADMEKYNAAAARGWLALRFTPDQIAQEAGDCLAVIQQAFATATAPVAVAGLPIPQRQRLRQLARRLRDFQAGRGPLSLVEAADDLEFLLRLIIGSEESNDHAHV